MGVTYIDFNEHSVPECHLYGFSQDWLELSAVEDIPGSHFRDSVAMRAFLLPWL